MNIVIKGVRKFTLAPRTRAAIEEKLSAALRLLGARAAAARLEVEVGKAPAEGRSSEPVRLVAVLKLYGETFHAEAVKPTPETAADRVRSELESEIRKRKGKENKLRRQARRSKSSR